MSSTHSERCKICKKVYSADCDWQQGRCPGHPAMIDVAKLRQKLVVLAQRFLRK